MSASPLIQYSSNGSIPLPLANGQSASVLTGTLLALTPQNIAGISTITYTFSGSGTYLDTTILGPSSAPWQGDVWLPKVATTVTVTTQVNGLATATNTLNLVTTNVANQGTIVGQAWNNAKNFNAFGNGSHDDTVALQGLLNAASVALASGGSGTAFLPTGIYVISSTLVIAPNVPGSGISIVGEGLPNTGAPTVIRANFPVLSGTTATISSIAVNTPTGETNLVTLTGLTGVTASNVKPGYNVQLTGAALHQNNVHNGTVISAGSGTITYYHFDLDDGSGGTVGMGALFPTTSGETNNGSIHWRITQNMFQMGFCRQTRFEGIRFDGGGTAGYVIDLSSLGSVGSPTPVQFSSDCQWDRCQWTNAVGGVKIGDFSLYAAGASGVTFPTNNDTHMFRDCQFDTMLDACVWCPNTTGQSKFIGFDRCNFQFSTWSTKFRTGSFFVNGPGITTNNTICFHAFQPTDTIEIRGMSDEGSARFGVFGGFSSGIWPVTLQGNRCNPGNRIATDGRYVAYGAAAPLIVIGNDFDWENATTETSLTIYIERNDATVPFQVSAVVIGNGWAGAANNIVSTNGSQNIWYWSFANRTMNGTLSNPVRCPDGLLAANGTNTTAMPSAQIGNWSAPVSALAISTGANNNVVDPGTTNVQIGTLGSAANVTGILVPADGATAIRDVMNLSGQNVTFNHNNSGSSAGNKLSSPTGADVVLATGYSLRLVYDLSATVWRLVRPYAF
jgi:hypothetical protein